MLLIFLGKIVFEIFTQLRFHFHFSFFNLYFLFDMCNHLGMNLKCTIKVYWRKPTVVVANKMDEMSAMSILPSFHTRVRDFLLNSDEKDKEIFVFPISAVTRMGLSSLVYAIRSFFEIKKCNQFYHRMMEKEPPPRERK